MPISLKESQAINKIAELLYDYLPANPHPFTDQDISFPGIANNLGLSQYWKGGSKLPALTTLLEKTLESKRNHFCNLILAIVRVGMKYRNNKGNPIKRNEIETLNELVEQVQFKIPELWAADFLDSLPRSDPEDETPTMSINQDAINELRDRFINLSNLEPNPRGYAFEKFLQEFFEAFGLDPRPPFKLVGEQIDGSFQLETLTYLVEAKWQNNETGQKDLLAFQGIVDGKAKWSRGLYISYNGFSDDGLEAFLKGKSTSILGMTSQDIYFILEGKITLSNAINRKARWAAETGEFYKSVFELSLEG